MFAQPAITIVMVVAAGLSSVLVTILVSQPTHALLGGLLERTTNRLDDTISPVTSLLLPDRQTTVTPTSRTSKQPGTSPTNAPAAQTPTTLAPVSEPVTTVTKPKTTKKQPYTLSPKLHQISFVGANMPGVSLASSNAIELATATRRPTIGFALLQPSAYGWRLLGLAWYWWTITIVTVFSTYRYRRTLQQLPKITFNRLNIDDQS